MAVLTQDVGTAGSSDEDTEAAGSEPAVRAALSGTQAAVPTEEPTVPSVPSACLLLSRRYREH